MPPVEQGALGGMHLVPSRHMGGGHPWPLPQKVGWPPFMVSHTTPSEQVAPVSTHLLVPTSQQLLLAQPPHGSGRSAPARSPAIARSPAEGVTVSERS